jgi:hypothetical protein
MKDEPGPAAVSRVEIHGQVDGIQLDPQPIPPDSLHADSSAARSRT